MEKEGDEEGAVSENPAFLQATDPFKSVQQQPMRYFAVKLNLLRTSDLKTLASLQFDSDRLSD